MSMLIDLGELAAAVEEPPSRALPPGPRAARDRRRVWLALVVVFALLAVGAAAAPADPMPRLFSVTALGDAPILFSGDRMYAMDRGAVVAYSLDDGSRLWRTPASLPPARGWGLDLFAGTLVLANYSDFADAGVVAFDARTGARRWTRSGNVVADVPHLRSVLVRDVGGDTLSLVDLNTGETRWREPWSDCQYDFDNGLDPSVWVRLCSDATLSTTDVATGRVTGSVKVDLTPADPYRGPAYTDGGSRLIVAYGKAVVSIFDGVSLNWWMSAYDLADLGLRWAHQPIYADGYLLPCPPDRLCMEREGTSSIISLATGQTIGTSVPPWDQPLRQVDVTGYRVGQAPAVVLTPDGAPLDTRSHDSVVFVSHAGDYLTAPRYSSSNVTWVFDARPDPAAPDGYRYRPIGKIPGVYATRCVAYARPTDRLLACATAVDTLTFWSVPG